MGRGVRVPHVAFLALASGLLAGVAEAALNGASFYADAFNAKGTHHYDYALRSEPVTDPVVEIKPGTQLLDAEGSPVFSRTKTDTQLVLVEGGPGRSYCIQQRTNLPGKRGASDPLVFIWGGGSGHPHGPRDPSFLLAGAKATERAPHSYSGFVYRSDIVHAPSSIPRHADHWNGFEGHGDWLRDIEASYLDRRYGEGGRATVDPRPVGGDYAPDHPLSDYGYAHGSLPDFAYGLWNVPDHAPEGGQTGVLLERGQKVVATTITLATNFEWPGKGRPTAAQETRDRTFVLCVVELLDRSHVGVWISLADLEPEAHAPAKAKTADRVVPVQPWVARLCAKRFKDVTGRTLPEGVEHDLARLLKAFEGVHLVHEEGAPPRAAFVFFEGQVVLSNGNGTAVGLGKDGQLETSLDMDTLGARLGWVTGV